MRQRPWRLPVAARLHAKSSPILLESTDTRRSTATDVWNVDTVEFLKAIGVKSQNSAACRI
jgi:hypothetical protein